ncbi:MAG: hypothetical protein EXR36_10970 [Betaproteobacteria bacterium]|nr:hypothetical protein [Betaproteobacteria bacterium]
MEDDENQLLGTMRALLCQLGEQLTALDKQAFHRLPWQSLRDRKIVKSMTGKIHVTHGASSAR